MFEARLPARKFRQYVCTGHINAGDGQVVQRKDSDSSEKGEVIQQEVVNVQKTA